MNSDLLNKCRSFLVLFVDGCSYSVDALGDTCIDEYWPIAGSCRPSCGDRSLLRREDECCGLRNGYAGRLPFGENGRCYLYLQLFSYFVEFTLAMLGEACLC